MLLVDLFEQQSSVQIQAIDDLSKLSKARIGERETVEMSYQTVVSKLGEPVEHKPGDEPAVLWAFTVTHPNGEPFLAAVYSDPHYKSDTNPSDIIHWNIACRSGYEASVVYQYLKF